MRTAPNQAEPSAPSDESACVPPEDRVIPSLTDTDLLDAWVHDGHRGSLAVLIERYRVMVMSVCRRRCLSIDDAEDAFQATFLHLARNAKSIRDPRRLPGWLQRVAQRAATATLKHSARETVTMVDTPADPDDPLDRLTQRHEAIVLDEELAELPEHYRAALVLHLFDGQSLAQLANQLGVTVGSVRGRLQRGKQLLASRLRRRGIVPVLAYAAAQACTASTASAASASATLIASIENLPGPGRLPDPAIEPSVLNPLLREGTRLMPTLYTTGALIIGSGLLSLLMLTGDGNAQTQTQNVVEIPASSATNSSSATSTASDHGSVRVTMSESSVTTPSSTAQNSSSSLTAADPSGTKISRHILQKLDEAVGLPKSFSLIELPSLLLQLAEVPVLLDERGIDYARVNLARQTVQWNMPEAPLRSALTSILEPLGLQAIVEDNGLKITANPSVLVHWDIGATRWINIDERAEQEISEGLQSPISTEWIDLPLEDALEFVWKSTNLPIYLNRRSLEEIGLTPDVPVTLATSHMQAENALQLVLDDLDLTYTVRGESLVVTTVEDSEERLLTRIYWLEGTGFSSSESTSLMDSLQSAINPDCWEQLGGASTMTRLDSGNQARPAIVVSSSYVVHRRIQKFISALRETHFGTESTDVKRSTASASPESEDRETFGGRSGGFM